MQGRGRAPLIRTARGRWLLIAAAAASALVLALSAGLQTFLGQLSANIATNSAPRHPVPTGGSTPGIQTRNASENTCSGLPKPNDLGELGR
jgi:hypothetical protein